MLLTNQNRVWWQLTNQSSVLSQRGAKLQRCEVAKVQGCSFKLLNLNTVKISRNVVDSSIRYPPPPLKCGSLTPVYRQAGGGWSSPPGSIVEFKIPGGFLICSPTTYLTPYEKLDIHGYFWGHQLFSFWRYCLLQDAMALCFCHTYRANISTLFIKH